LIVEAEILTPEEVCALQTGLAAAPFREGRLTAGAVARGVKDNEQARGDDPDVIALASRVRIALENAALVRRWIRPARWSSLMFSRYRTGHVYGLHTDDALIRDASGWPLRTDISFTLFLSGPDTYDGGALAIEEAGAERIFRPPAGSAVFYPTGHLHRVTPVTRGERLACVGWIQSLIRRADQRELLFDLEQVRAATKAADESLVLDKAIGNLIRMWSED
jgi:PKHD-type hydroxylase